MRRGRPTALKEGTAGLDRSAAVIANPEMSGTRIAGPAMNEVASAVQGRTTHSVEAIAFRASTAATAMWSMTGAATT